MQVDGYLHLYTTLIGWHHYGLLWSLLTGVGLVFLPILGIVFDHLSDVRSQGSLMSTNPDGALAGLEVRLFTVMLVVLVAAVPTSFTTLTPASLQYTTKSSVYEDATTATTTDPGSTWGDSVDFDGYNFTDGVSVPAFWFLVMQISQGLKYAMLNATDTRGESFRALKRMADIASIENPELRWHVNTFYTHCYAPAVHRYRKQTLDATQFLEPEADLTTTPALETVGPDIHWIGSEYFNEKAGFYKDIQVPVLVKGFAFDATRNTEYTSAQSAGSPMCDQYWTRIRDSIYNQGPAQDFVTLADRAQTWLPGFLGGKDTDELKNEIAQMYLHNTPKELSLTADQQVSLRNAGNAGLGQSIVELIGDAAQAINLTRTAILVDMGLDALIYALAIGQAYILMALYLLLPIGLLVSRYSIAFLMQAGILIFAISFWTVLWGLAAWLDNVMALAIWGDQGALGTFADSGLDGYNKRIIHAISIGFLYVLGPIASTWILTAAGSRVGYTLSGAARNAGMGIGSSSAPLSASSSANPAALGQAANQGLRGARAAYGAASNNRQSR